ncbi:hypothetical protein M5K25_000415 [Dendrobium thyrsiflorum]|uniref:Fungal lipase-type domain-containing protein n=1 Tax=Dendrobium thyrsiflorum TaxID=117978 RepID=A0ABD0W742_DENTH
MVELEREKSLGEGVWRGFYTVAPASSHRSTSKSRFVLREVLKKKIALVSKDQVLCLLQEEEKVVNVLCLTGLVERFVRASPPCCGSKRRVTIIFSAILGGEAPGSGRRLCKSLWQPESRFSLKKLEERALSLRGERVELEREKSLGEGVWRGFYTVAPASSHRSTSKSRFVLREVLKKKTALVSKDQVLCLLQEEEKEVKVLCLTGLVERFVRASPPCCGSKRRVTIVFSAILGGEAPGSGRRFIPRYVLKLIFDLSLKEVMERRRLLEVMLFTCLFVVCAGRELKSKDNQSSVYNGTLAKILVEYTAAVYTADLTSLLTWTCSRCIDMTEGFEVVEVVVDVQNCLQAYVGVAEDLNSVIVVFRGTQEHSIQNWVEDLYWKQLDLNYPDMPGSMVHHGFYSAYHNTTMRPGILYGLQKIRELYGDMQITVVGHSMGGAMAAFCALDLKLAYLAVLHFSR